MKKFLAVFLALLLTSFAAAYADGETAQTHTHCVCGKTVCEENHEETGTVNWQTWDGDTAVGTVTDSSAAAIYLYLENDVTIRDTLEITNVTVFLCLNGKTLTIDREGYPAVGVGGNQKFVLCDCKGTGKITGAKGSAEHQSARFGAINGRSGSNIVMYGGSISDNTVENSNGGGIYVNGGTLTIYGGSFVNNKAPNGSGGAFSVENGTLNVYGGEMKNNSATNGGAIHLKGNTDAIIQNIKANGNTASGMGGAIFTEVKKVMNIKDSEFAYNNAANGGAIYIKNIEYNIYSHILNVNVHDNTATGSGGGFYINGQYKTNSCVNIGQENKLSCFYTTNNKAGSDGGGIYATNGAEVNLRGATISSNSCTGNGGGICVIRSSITTNCLDEVGICYINNNSAEGQGGGVYTDSANNKGNSRFLFARKSEINGNVAKKEGGGIYIRGVYSYLALGDATITENKALQGGGVFLNNGNVGRDLQIIGTVLITGNTLLSDGSPNNLYLNNGKKFVVSGTATENTKIGVTASNTPTDSEQTGIVYDSSDHTKLIESDNDDYMIVYDGTSKMHYLAVSNRNKPSMEVRWDSVVVFKVSKPTLLFVASYNGNNLIDVKSIELSKSEKQFISINADRTEDGIQINTENATKISAFLWDNTNGITNMQPLCESGAAEVSAQ